MKISATRTLMKSAPELWELLDDEPQLRHWSACFCDGEDQIEVVAREPGRLLTWRSDGSQPVKVKVKLAEKGFGTQVAISAKARQGLREDALELVLDELAEPQRRPFSAV
jgi:hypothetical protein